MTIILRAAIVIVTLQAAYYSGFKAGITFVHPDALTAEDKVPAPRNTGALDYYPPSESDSP